MDAGGLVTVLFTDIEASTDRWEADPTRMGTLLSDHDAVLDAAIERHGGTRFKHTGDGVCAVFPTPRGAVEAALESQAELSLPVRMGLHTGVVDERNGDYFGPTMNRVARIMDAGHGGQTLMSLATAALVPEYELTDLGEHDLKGLSSPERIFQVGTAEFPPLRVASARRGNLPTERSTFLGRAAETAAIADRTVDHRLVTLIGIGGTGKTRLAIEVAGRLGERFVDGCWIAELAPVTVGEAVPFAIARELGVPLPGTGDVLDHVVARIRDERRLLIVDNCEHVLVDAADAIERLVDGCPNLSVIATSREALMIRGEQLIPVGSLAVEEAVELFLARAADEAPGTDLGPTQSEAIAQLVDRLDRLPLAIELAASRSRVLTPVDMLAGLDERFRMLSGGRRSRIERHQTMRGTLDWSYELCDAVEQDVFDALSVFATAFDVAAALAVVDPAIDANDAIDAIHRLVERSMVQRVTDDDGTSRYLLLETMRAYGREHLAQRGSADATLGRHAVLIADIVSRLGLASFGPDERAVRDRIRRIVPELVPALDWFVEHRAWSQAVKLTGLRFILQERLPIALAGRVRAGLDAAGEPLEVLSPHERFHIRLMTMSASWALWRTGEGLYAAAIEALRSDDPLTVDCLLSTPFGAAMFVEVADDDGWDLIAAALPRLANAPAAVRFLAHFFVVEAAYQPQIGRDDTDAVAESRRQLTLLADELQSRRAHRYVVGQHAVVAARAGDLEAALQLVETSFPDDDDPSYIDVMAACRVLRWSAQTGRMVGGDELRRPWKWLVEGGFTFQVWIALHSTASALDVAGFTELAVRLLARARPIATEAMWSHMSGILRTSLAARLVDLEPTSESIEVLAAAVFDAADELDERHGRRRAASPDR